MIELNEDYNLIVSPDLVFIGGTVKVRFVDKSGLLVNVEEGNKLKEGAKNAYFLKTSKCIKLDIEPDIHCDLNGVVTFDWELKITEEEYRPGGCFIDVCRVNTASLKDSRSKSKSKQRNQSPECEECIASEKLEIRTPNGMMSHHQGNMSKSLADLSEGISMKSTERPRTRDLPLWVTIENSTKSLSFENYSKFMDMLLCNEFGGEYSSELNGLKTRRFLPFSDTDGYRTLKVATEAFVMVNCGVELKDNKLNEAAILETLRQKGMNISSEGGTFQEIWSGYLKKIGIRLKKKENGETVEEELFTVPYLYLIRRKLKDLPLKVNTIDGILDRFTNTPAGAEREVNEANCFGIISQKLTHSCFIELIWSYWHEECMLVQGINAICQRFQNIKTRKNDPLAAMGINPLQPLNNLLWGFIQDERNRLSVQRRNHEFMNHYGFGLIGKAISRGQFADTRTRFLESFHQLLYLCTQYYKQEDDATVLADAFPIRNALREVHLVLSEGAHNQYGDLPTTARIENLMQQYILARPEFRQFISGRTMVAYPEAWMERVATLNKIMGWTDISPIHFSRLANFGEKILLSIRFGDWSETNTTSHQAGVWANFWRQAIQEYIHAYHAVSGIDLAATRVNGQKIDSRPPSYHLAKRLVAMQKGKIPKPSQNGIPIKKGTVKKEWF